MNKMMEEKCDVYGAKAILGYRRGHKGQVPTRKKH